MKRLFMVVAFLGIACEMPTSHRESAKGIKSIMESVHDPGTRAEDLEDSPVVAENSIIVKTSFDVNGHLLSKERFNSRGQLEGKTVHTYDEHGNNVRTDEYHFKGLAHVVQSKFDASGNLTESQVRDADGKLIERQRVVVGKGGAKTATRELLSMGRWTKVSEEGFDGAGRSIGKLFYSGTNLVGKEMNRYDDAGNAIETIQSDLVRNEDRVTHRKYDERQNNTEVVVQNKNLMIESKTIFSYDDKNNVVSVSVYGVMGNVVESETYVYEYDEAGNWTSRTKLENRRPVSVTFRKIEYY